MTQSISNNTNNFSSLGAPISEHRRMKKSAFVFTVVPAICFALGIFFFVAGFLTTGSIKEPASSLILTLIFFACGVPLWITARRERDLLLRVFTDGFSYRRNHQETVARWSNVENVYEDIETRAAGGVPASTFYKYTIELKDGKRIKTSGSPSRRRSAERFGRSFFRVYLSKPSSATMPGRKAKFGELSVSKSGLKYRQKSLLWSELRETQLINGHLKIISVDGKTAWATIALAKIPNYFVLTALLDDILKA